MQSSIPAAEAEFALVPGEKVLGRLARYAIRRGDNFNEIARRFDIGYTELAAANPGINPWSPPVGHPINIPSAHILPDAPHRGIVINLAQWRLFYFAPDGGRVETHPIGLGVIGKTTPLGSTRVVRKQANPTWRPPPSIRAERPGMPAVVPAGPDNPLGAFALYLGWPRYLIHGTNKPAGVGRNVSHGCVRLYPEDIAQLFEAVPVGTPVRTVNQPASAGWQGERLYVEVYPSKRQTEEIDTERPVSDEPARGVRAVVKSAAGRHAPAVNWDAVDAAANERTGMPVLVADLSANAPQSDRRPEARAATSRSVAALERTQ